jgi:thioredoxin 1
VNEMLAVDKDNFEAEVLEEEKVVLVDFWSEGCEPCKALMPDIETLEEVYGDQIKFVKLDTTKARRLAIKQKVLGLPTIAIYQGGEKKDEVTKEQASKENVEAMIKKFV